MSEPVRLNLIIAIWPPCCPTANRSGETSTIDWQSRDNWVLSTMLIELIWTRNSLLRDPANRMSF